MKNVPFKRLCVLAAIPPQKTPLTIITCHYCGKAETTEKLQKINLKNKQVWCCIDCLSKANIDNTFQKAMQSYQYALAKINWYKIAIDLNQRSQALKLIFNSLPGKRTKTDRITNDSVEKMLEDVQGTCWIQVYYREWYAPGQDAIGVEKYYESEHMQDAYGQTKIVIPNWDNPQETLEKVRQTIAELEIGI